MTAIAVTNQDESILQALFESLRDATINGKPAFVDVSIMGSREEADDKVFKGSPVAAVVYTTTESTLIADLENGCDWVGEVLIAVAEDDPVTRNLELTKRTNALRNAIEDGGIPALAKGFPDSDGDLHPRMNIGTPERADDVEDPWIWAWVPVRVAYIATSRTTH